MACQGGDHEARSSTHGRRHGGFDPGGRVRECVDFGARTNSAFAGDKHVVNLDDTISDYFLTGSGGRDHNVFGLGDTRYTGFLQYRHLRL
jgi:hypothetical protein